MGRNLYDWAAVQRFYDEGHGMTACMRAFRLSHTAWIKAVRRGDLILDPRPFADRRRRYDWSAIQRFYDDGHSYRACRERFGFTAMAWHKARMRGEIRTRPNGRPLTEILENGKSRWNIKQRLLGAGLLSNRCDECGLTDWRSKPLAMHLDHINGIPTDHRLENLRMLCPNCHSQTHTYGGRNMKRRRRLQDRREVV